MLRRCFENVTQGRDERVDAATHVLEIDQQNVETIHHRRRRPAHFTVKTKNRNAVRRVVEICRLDHVVLLVAAQPMLRAEGGGELYIFQQSQRIEGMH